MSLRHCIHLVAAVLAFSSVRPAEAATCIEQIDPFDPQKIRTVPCSREGSDSTSFSAGRKVNTHWSTSSSNFFDGNGATVQALKEIGPASVKVNFACHDSVLPRWKCKAASLVFDRAAALLQKKLLLRRTVVVAASFSSFSKTHPGENQEMTLGHAYPNKWIIITDQDGVDRMYTQAHAKQLALDDLPQFDNDDIRTEFNADHPWVFTQSEAQTAGAEFYDFLSAVLHEMMHGLLIVSAWGNYIGTKMIPVLTPTPFTTENGVEFLSSAMDRILVERPESRFHEFNSVRVAKLNEFKAKPHTKDEFSRVFQSSPQRKLADEFKNLAVNNHKTLALYVNMTSTRPFLFLETSIPWSPGSSISHLLQAEYEYSADFLMVHTLGGNANGKAYGPDDLIGPGLLKTFEVLGFPTVRRPEPLYKPLRVSPVHRETLNFVEFKWWPIAVACVAAIFCACLICYACRRRRLRKNKAAQGPPSPMSFNGSMRPPFQMPCPTAAGHEHALPEPANAYPASVQYPGTGPSSHPAGPYAMIGSPTQGRLMADGPIPTSSDVGFGTPYDSPNHRTRQLPPF